ncbi:MAG TPA: DUF1326 domain-containing protein [Vicinamibacterales bacterium]|nr:DUF1326 domain-containing protein [Vicinamibacterales bacterium]
MKHLYTVAALIAVGFASSVQASDPAVVGDYVETRTAEVFTGPCILGSEGEVSGREAIMAWRVAKGSIEGVALDGLAVVAVVAADQHLSLHEYGAPKPSSIRAVVMTDSRATAAQQSALVSMARGLAPGMFDEVVSTRPVPITFERGRDSVHVAAGAATLDVVTEFEHPVTCGATRWFNTLSKSRESKPGLTRSQEWSGKELGLQWRQIDSKSSYVGTFTYAR